MKKKTDRDLQHRRRLSIKWRLFACFGAFTAVVLLVLWLFQVVFLDDFYKFIKSRQTENAAQKIEKVLGSSELGSELQYIARSGEVCILITDRSGATLESCDYLAGCIIHRIPESMKQELIEKAYGNGGSYSVRFDLGGFGADNRTKPRGESNESIVFVKAVTDSPIGEAVIFVNATITPVNATVETLRIQIYIVTGVLILVGLILALLFSRVISRPISKLNASAKELAKGNYNADFSSADGYGEITELGDSLAFASEELSKLDSLKSELVANISHDLRTPLTLITGYAEVMRDIPDENSPENLQVIIDESRRLSSLVTDVLDVSKLRSGSVTLSITEFNLTETVRASIARFSKLAEKEGFSFEFLCDAEVIVAADELRISQVIYNLINNAVIHADGSKTVRIEQLVGESFVTVGVIDRGKGIPRDKLKNIWERYYRVDEEHKRAQTGSGLGLSIVRSVIDLHNSVSPHSAACGVKSEEGVGSTFWFALKYLRAERPDDLSDGIGEKN